MGRAGVCCCRDLHAVLVWARKSVLQAQTTPKKFQSSLTAPSEDQQHQFGPLVFNNFHGFIARIKSL